MAIAATRIRRRTNDSAATRALVQSVFLALVDLALLNQMRVRPDLWHGMPAAVASLPLLAFLLGAYGLGGVASSSRQVVQRILALVAAPVVITTGLAGFLWSVSSTVHVPLSIPRATAIRDNPANQYYRELVSYVIEMTSPDESIYSGVSDHTRLFVNDALLYFLSNRSSATRFIQMDPGIANTESAQKAIRDTLEQRRVRMVVLLDIQSGEANLSSRSNGVHLLDRFIRERYWETRRFGPYRVMELE